VSRAKLSDVAARAGISPGAASLALNGRPGVSAKTREDVRRIARELGYIPSPTAKALVGGSSGLWGAFTESDPDIWPTWLAGVMTHAQAAGARLVVQKLPTRERRTDFFRTIASEGHLDGMILLDQGGEDNSLRSLWELGIPTVIAGRRSHWFDCVEIHERLAQENLHGLLTLDGKRPVVAVATRSQVNQEAPRLALWSSLSPENKDTVVVAEDAPESGVQALNLIRRQHPHAQAVFCLAGDRTAWGMLREARLHSISVPGELAIAGWGDLPHSGWTDPELTTIHIPWEEMGIRSAWLLQKRLAHPEEGRLHRSLDAKLVSRRSG